jgi:hypothetical protein
MMSIRTFPVWLALLMEDARRNNKLREMATIGDLVLEIFWQDGCEPTIAAMIEFVEKAA